MGSAVPENSCLEFQFRENVLADELGSMIDEFTVDEVDVNLSEVAGVQASVLC